MPRKVAVGLGAEFAAWRKTGVKKIGLCKAGIYCSAAAPTSCKAESARVHSGVGGLLPPCLLLLQVHLRGLAGLPHISDVAEVSVTAGVG